MAEITLPCGTVTVVDDDMLPLVQQYRWRLYDNGKHRYVQADVWIDGRKTTIRIHRLILGLVRFRQSRHLDGDTLNNRRENLVTINRNMLPPPTKYMRWKEGQEEHHI